MSEQLPVYVIYIQRARERLEEVQALAQLHSIEIEPVDGVDGGLVPPEEWVETDRRLFGLKTGRRILPGEYGCYRSHIKALELFLASGRDAAIIAEDDIVPDADFMSRAKAVHQAVPNAGIIKFTNHRNSGFIRRCRSTFADEIGRCVFGPQGSSACYLVTRKGAQRILAKARIMTLPYDRALERSGSIGAPLYVVKPSIIRFGLSAVGTSIASREAYRKSKFNRIVRVPAYLFRAFDHIQRAFYAVI